MICEYCGTENEKQENCQRCGAPLPKKQKEDFWRSDPFFYNGYICYQLRNFVKDAYEVQFWLGRELIERIEIPYQMLREIVPEGCDCMNAFWNLFLVARGEKDIFEYSEKNKIYPAMFEVRRIENKEVSIWVENYKMVTK